MKKTNVQTPAVMVDLDILERNIRRIQELCDQNGKQLWPMIKTHKSTEIVKMQAQAGAKGFLCGTLDECEGVFAAGIGNIMYAYPVASEVNARRVADLAGKCNFIIRIDNYESARMIHEAAKAAGVKVNYTIIVDSGLHRLGILPEQVVDFANSIRHFTSLFFKGVSTHPGHVYSAANQDDIKTYAADEKRSMKMAVELLKDAGYDPEIISSGSTPSFFDAVTDEYINVYHPGNYVFMDNTQINIGIVGEVDCALYVYATIISNPRPGEYICDAGSKCLGLDSGSNSNSAADGYGYVKGHPELTVAKLSEEIGRLFVKGSTDLKVGDKIEIIPNHTCTTANLTSCLIGCRGEEAQKLIHVDMRGNSTTKGFNKD